MAKFGIDISRWQKGFNFDKAVSEGVEFAILRGAYHTDKDICFEEFYAACKSRNIPVGVYLYSIAKTVAEAKAEADFLIANVLKGKQFEYPIYLDVEDKVQKALDKKLLTDIIVAFCEAMEKAGYYVGIYSTASFLKSYTEETRLAAYDKWIAHWAKKCTYTGDFGLWQFGGETNLLRSNKVAGVVCDQDYAYKDYPTIIKKSGLNGYGKAQTEKKETTYTLKEFIKDVQKACGAKVDGIAGPETLSKTVTLSSSKNRTHAAVKPVQKRLYALGYKSVGTADGIAGIKFESAVLDFQKDNKCWQDGEITAGKTTWKKLLGMS